MLRILAVDISGLFSVRWEINQGKEDSHAHQATLRAVAAAREGFDRVAICCDAGASWRRAIWPEYKANRPQRAAGYKHQLERTIEQLGREGCSVFVAPPVNRYDNEGVCYYAEADDVLGTLCAWALEGGHSVRILSGDKDLLQCVSGDAKTPDICFIDRVDYRGIVMGPADVEAKLGVPPSRVPDWLALAGDKSDGYKPFPGLGDVKAVALIKYCGTALAVFEDPHFGHLHEIVGDAVAKTLRTPGAKERAARCLEVASVMRDLTMDFRPLLFEPIYVPTPAASKVDFVPVAPAAAPAAVPMTAAAAPAKEPPPDAVEPSKGTTIIKRASIESYQFNPFALEPTDPKQALDLATCVYNSTLFRKFPNIEAAMMVILEGRSLGVPSIVALKNAYVVDGGAVGWSARFLRGLVMKSGLCEYFDIVESDMDHALAICKRVGRPEFRVLSTTQMAAQRGLILEPRAGNDGKLKRGNKWYSDPLSMNLAEVDRRGSRMGWPDVVAGLYTPDEVELGSAAEGVEILEAA